MNDNSKSFEISRSTRSTGMGAYTNAHLFSFRQEKELSPHRHNSSRTGNHGVKTWFLLPGTYIEMWINRSNSGKGDWHIDVLTVDDAGNQEQKPLTDPPEWLRPLVDADIWEAVYPTPYH